MNTKEQPFNLVVHERIELSKMLHDAVTLAVLSFLKARFGKKNYIENMFDLAFLSLSD